MSSRRCTACTSARRTGRRSATTSHCFLRSSLKPIQAIPLARGLRRPRLRRARDRVRLAPGRAGAARGGAEAARARRRRASTTSRTALQDGRPDGKLGHNCSGKHAGMLAACRAHGWPLHPVSRARASAAAADRRARRPGRRRASTAAACRRSQCRSPGWPTLFATHAGADRSRDARASRARRRQSGADDTDLMRALPGWIAKRGAEGLFCALVAGRRRLGVQGRGRLDARAPSGDRPGARHRRRSGRSTFATASARS